MLLPSDESNLFPIAENVRKKLPFIYRYGLARDHKIGNENAFLTLQTPDALAYNYGIIYIAKSVQQFE